MTVSHPGGEGLPNVNRGPSILVATSIVTGCALATVVARMYVRVFVIRNVGFDDWAMLLTMLLSLAGWAIIVPEVKYGAGRHTVYVEKTAVKAMHLNFATQAIYLWSIGLVKISIGFFLLRFAPKRGYKIFIITTLIFECKDIRTIWDSSIVSKCFTTTELLALSYTNTALNILTDFIFATLPALMLRHLQVNRRTKASLTCILSLGVLACAAACVKLSILPHYGQTGDFLWDYTDLTIWVVAESNIGIIAGSLPTLKPLFKRFLDTYASRSKSQGYTSGGRDTFRMQKLAGSRSRYGPGSRGSRQMRISNGGDDFDALRDGKSPTVANGKGKGNGMGFGTVIVSTRGGSNSSEERILPLQGSEGIGIMMTREVEVTETRGND
ncbi:hypothetical protein ASPZODRAFT_65422 [Penicilliopsis zonata CBS 506.65]|uniref:Rhodopsin domain-containing protein n=1 Tax=Penicilliopsis zonata CBS 506.65 TaxID=1073090 RepID=A0A1L9SJL1_9EURO|nr:hypothetical protein ASPZODRAFT_65422 [Penicilliopsis zonata CBS 506.65]OJJ47301.1 hypothetical protein ASPZODRAFT_65422 [Penicilliopsis zonata CBS 506.65]